LFADRFRLSIGNPIPAGESLSNILKAGVKLVSMLILVAVVSVAFAAGPQIGTFARHSITSVARSFGKRQYFDKS
jgi:hypothetical protein